MFRKQLFSLVLIGLIVPFGMPTAESQEIRLEPPQLDRQGIIRSARPTGRTAMNPRMNGNRMGRLARPGMRTSMMGAPRLGVSRVARQQPLQRSGSQGIYGMSVTRQAQDDAAGGSIIQENSPTMQGEPLIQDGIIIEDEGVYMGEEPCIPACRPYQLVSFADMEYTLGVQGFKGVPNLGSSGSFGFNQGINWGFPMPVLPILGLSGQIGFRFTQADFYGADFTPETRNQSFLTAGISRRVDYGFQMGVAFDYLNDRWYYDGSFAQIRSDFSWVGGYGNQLGFRFTSGIQDSSDEVMAGLTAVGHTLITDFSPLDTYRFYYRQQWDQMRGGHVELMGGFTGNGDGMFGAEFLIPIAERWALTSDCVCLLPGAETDALRRIDESWHIGMGLTWYPKGLSTWSKLYHRPLFNVADNGSFMFGR